VLLVLVPMLCAIMLPEKIYCCMTANTSHGS
jgi:hypothetical protein